MDAEKYLAIEKASRNELNERKEREAKVPKETLAEIEELEAMIRRLTKQYNEASAENLELKSRVAKVELELTELKKALEKLLS